MRRSLGWLLGIVLAAGGQAAEVLERAAAVGPPMVKASGTVGSHLNTLLTSGVSMPFSFGPATPCATQPGVITLFTEACGYRIDVPAGASRLIISVGSSGPDVDLYVRSFQDVDLLDGAVLFNHASESLSGSETLVISGGSTPVLQSGSYYIALSVYPGGTASGSLAATLEFGAPVPAAVRQLTSGVPAPFAFDPRKISILFRGAYSYRIAVPSGASQLQIQVSTSTPGANIDVFGRYNEDVGFANGQPIADYFSTGPTGSETITIPSPFASTYFIALRLTGPSGSSATGNVTATVTGGGGGGGPNSDLTGVWSWSAACNIGNFSGQFRVNTQSPGGAFSGEFLNTNANDVGTLSGQIAGSSVSFTRSYSGGSQIWSSTVVSTLTGLRLDGTISGVGVSCTFVANRSGSGGGGGGGGGGSGPNLLTNGGFETAGGTSGALGWNLLFGSVDRWAGYTCSEATWCMDLDGSSFGGIAQTFSTTPGTTYVVTFDLAGNPGGAPTIKQMQARVAGISRDYQFDITGRSGSSMGWRTESFSFTATSGSSTLEFRSTNTTGGFHGAFIDNVRVETSGGGGGGGACTRTGTGGYSLNRIEARRTYPAGFTGTIGPLNETASAEQCSFRFGWDYRWSNMVNLNRTIGQVNFNQVTAALEPGGQATFAATMVGDWNTTGYGVARDHTIRLAGFLSGEDSIVGEPSAVYSRSFSRTNTVTASQPTAGEITLTLTATIRFGDDHVGTMELRFIYRSGGGGGGGGGGGQVGGNLIQNPGAEESAALAGCNRAAGSSPPARWTDGASGRAGACAYGDAGFGGPGLADRPPNGGSNFFNGGWAGNSTLSQNIDVSSLASQIDAGATYELSGYLGGFGGDGDSAAIRATFRDASASSLGSAQIGPVTPADRSNATRFLLRNTTGNVPRGTRRIEVTLNMVLAGGSSNDGYADNLSLVLSSQGGGGGGGGGGNTPVLSVAPSLDFGNAPVGDPRDMNLAIRNTGAASLRINNVTSSNTAEFFVLGPAIPFDVAPDRQQDLMLRFRPSASGARSSVLTIASNDPTRPNITVNLSGFGGAGGGGGSLNFAASTTSLNFNTQPGVNPSPQTFTLQNTYPSGQVTFRITSTQAWLSPSPPSGVLAVQQSTTVTVSVNVTGLAAGNHTGELRVEGGPPVGAKPDAVVQGAPLVITIRLTIGAGGGGPCPAGPSGSPNLPAGSVVNGASFVNAALPGGAIARGAIFSLFGANVGPTQLVQASRFPLELELGCVTIRVTLGSTTVQAIPLAVVAGQINAIMPSNAPIGEVTITVVSNNRTSNQQRIRVVESSFGFFSVNQSGSGPGIVQNFESATQAPLNSPRRTIRRGQRAVAYGSGLGGISGADNQPAGGNEPRVNVELTLGGRPQVVEYAGRTPGFSGLDQVNFVVSDDAPLGCYVPLVLRVGGVISNTVTVAVSDDPGSCSDPANPYSRFGTSGGSVGSIQMIRLNARLQLDATANFTNIDADVGTAVFARTPPGGEFAYNPITALPPLGSCSSFSAGGIDLSGILGGQLPGAGAVNATILNAGPALAVTGPGGNKTLPRSTDVGGLYFNLIGGTVPIPGLPLPSSPLYLNPGDYTVTGPGGPEVGSFTARFTVPASFTWSNRDSVAQSNRSSGVTLTWTGGDPATQAITILGGNLDQQSGAGVLFLCFSEFAPRTFTVPAQFTLGLPPSNLQRPDQTIGFLAIGAGPREISPISPLPTGLDALYAYFAQFSVLSVIWR